MTVPTLFETEGWYCPNCHFSETIPRIAKPHTRMHVCPKMAYLTTPLVAEGVKAKVVRHERPSYVGKEIVRTDADGRPAFLITTTRDDGEDVTVYAPTATATAD